MSGKVGAPITKFNLTEEQLDLAIDLAIEGETIKTIAEALCISTKTFWKCRDAYPKFGNQFCQARKEGVHQLVDKLDEIHNNIECVNRARLASDNIKWKASKVNADTYGDRIELNVNQKVDIGSALLEARARALPIRDVAELVGTDSDESNESDDTINIDKIDEPPESGDA